MSYARDFQEESDPFVSVNRFIQPQESNRKKAFSPGTARQIVQRQENEVTSVTQNGITYYSTREEAEANVPAHVFPKNCFVWNDGPQGYPWRPIPGTGCAHWVAHELGIDGNPGCYVARAIRVTQVIDGKTRYNLADAQLGDIWTNTNRSHCGIVRRINRDQDGRRVSVSVEHCSSGQGGVVTGNFSSGYFYR